MMPQRSVIRYLDGSTAIFPPCPHNIPAHEVLYIENPFKGKAPGGGPILVPAIKAQEHPYKNAQCFYEIKPKEEK